MTQVKTFEFNDFSENTYILHDETGACVIVDPGCFYEAEREELAAYIARNQLKVKRLLLTHAHLDHVFGNQFVFDAFGVSPEMHVGETPVLDRYMQACQMYGVRGAQPSPEPVRFITVGEVITFGNTRLETIFTPGHSPASISFYCREAGFVIAGDVLFRESIGRTDLPGGHHETLLESIRTQLFTLPDTTIVYSGHGPSTTIAYEKRHNPFLNGTF